MDLKSNYETPCKNNKNLNIDATPKLGAKNQLDCPSGYIKNKLLYIIKGPEKANALYGLQPNIRAISNWRNQKANTAITP